MAKLKYGIDLGTTNSAICSLERGVPVIGKIEVTDDTMPSCVCFPKKGRINVGRSARNRLNSDKKKQCRAKSPELVTTFAEFKRTMGTDQKYVTPNAELPYTSEMLSAEVLKALKSYIQDQTVEGAVVTVPAKFTVGQKTATMEAAHLAGIKQCELLQEPIAAAMAYGMNTKEKQGYWMVFDFGGGTFDAALLRVEDGVFQVFDTEGDNYLGGKDLDYAITDAILMPYMEKNFDLAATLSDPARRSMLRDAMKVFAEKIKNELSFKAEADFITDIDEMGDDDSGESIDIDLTVTREQAEDAMRPVFQKALDLCKKLLRRNNIDGSDLSKLILVGGPTHAPLLRQMVREQITEKTDCSLDPMTVVAQGAALFASTIEADGHETRPAQRGQVMLDIEYEATTVEPVVVVPVKIASGPGRVKVCFVRSDRAWKSSQMEIDATGDVAELYLKEDTSNCFEVQCFDSHGNRLECSPSEINIMQGAKVGRATLPYDISLGVTDFEKNKDVVQPVKGLERNKPLPATGVANGLLTTILLRPGVAEDALHIPVYQAAASESGKSVKLFDCAGEITVTGFDIERQIPKDAHIDVTIKVDRNEQMSIIAFFPDQDVEVEKRLVTNEKQGIEAASEFIEQELPAAEEQVEKLRESGVDTSELEKKLQEVRQGQEAGSEPRQVQQQLRQALMDMESLEDGTAWQRAEADLRHEFDKLERWQKEQGNSQTAKMVESFRHQTEQVIATRDVKAATQLAEKMYHEFVQLNIVDFCRFWIMRLDSQFDTIGWSDRARARQLLDRGKAALITNPSRETLAPVLQQVFQLMPDSQRDNMPNLPGIHK